MTRSAAITIDVDSLRFYHQIHGKPGAAGEDADPIYAIALPRFFELLEAVKAPATLFLIGEDAARHAAAFAPARTLGCEIASHSFRHDYALSRLPRDTIEADLIAAEAALSPLAGGQPIRGFRAPGYNVSTALLEIVLRRGYQYDSSLLPSPAYFAARAAAIGGYRVLGRPSASLVGEPRAYAGPLEPYRTHPDRPWQPDPAGPLIELPISCTPFTRVPLFGTSWSVFPSLARRLLLEAGLARLPSFNLELHAIDLLDHSDPGVGALAQSQADLRVPVAHKLRVFGELFRRLAGEFELGTLATLASRLRSS